MIVIVIQSDVPEYCSPYAWSQMQCTFQGKFEQVLDRIQVYLRLAPSTQASLQSHVSTYSRVQFELLYVKSTHLCAG